MLDHITLLIGINVFEEHLRKLHDPSRCMIMISSEIKTKTTAIRYNGRPINQYSFINGIAAMHRQEEEEVLFCHSNNCTMHNNPLIFTIKT